MCRLNLTGRKNFFNNIGTPDITDNKTFWKAAKPSFTNNAQTNSKITLIEKKLVSKGQEQIVSEKVITEDQAVAGF